MGTVNYLMLSLKQPHLTSPHLIFVCTGSISRFFDDWALRRVEPSLRVLSSRNHEFVICGSEETNVNENCEYPYHLILNL